jgi:hypothetical protein
MNLFLLPHSHHLSFPSQVESSFFSASFFWQKSFHLLTGKIISTSNPIDRLYSFCAHKNNYKTIKNERFAILALRIQEIEL